VPQLNALMPEPAFAVTDNNVTFTLGVENVFGLTVRLDGHVNVGGIFTLFTKNEHVVGLFRLSVAVQVIEELPMGKL
jgi:hypothetical protein